MRRNFRSRRGAALVEASVVLTTLFVVIWGLFEFGAVALRQNLLDDAARRIARAAVLRGEDSVQGIWGPDPLAFKLSEDEEFVRFVGPARFVIRPADIDVSIEWPDQLNTSNARVAVKMRHERTFLLGALWGRDSVTLQSRAVDYIE